MRMSCRGCRIIYHICQITAHTCRCPQVEYITTLPKQIKGVAIAEVHSLAMSPSMQLYAGVSTVRRVVGFSSAI